MKMMKQQYTSKETSISTVNKVYTNMYFAPGSIILDYGGGKYDKNVEYMQSKGCKVLVYDPYNRTEEHNRAVMEYVKNNSIDYVVCSNVLNVIKEDSVVQEVLTDIHNIQEVNKDKCVVYIKVYEGNKSGIGKQTKKGYQRNLSTKNYLSLVSKFLPKCIIKKGTIISSYF